MQNIESTNKFDSNNTTIATAFPADCLPHEGYFELQETLYMSINGLNQEAMHLQLNMREKWLLNCLLYMQLKPPASQYTRQAPMCRKCYAIGHKMTWKACP